MLIISEGGPWLAEEERCCWWVKLRARLSKADVLRLPARVVEPEPVVVVPRDRKSSKLVL